MTWDQLAAGENCPFCMPREEANAFYDFVLTLEVSSLYLLKNQAYRGHCVLIYDARHALRPDELSLAEWNAYCADLHRVIKPVMSVCEADHINVEMMGNQMPHMHWQVVPRYKTDRRWGMPIWTSTADELHQVRLKEKDRARLIADLREAIAGEIPVIWHA